MDIKEENKANVQKEIKAAAKKPKFMFLHDVAMLHCAAARNQKMRANLLSNIGPHRRALCARRDLYMRRQLCKVGKVSQV